jgi:hypothetical protein
MAMYSKEDIKIVGKSYQTTDGKYQTKTSSSSFYYDAKGDKKEYNKGYNYWYDNDGMRLGSTSYDYLFFIGKDGISNAVNVLNSVIEL